MKQTAISSPIQKAYRAYLRHLKEEHPLIYAANKKMLEDQMGLMH